MLKILHNFHFTFGVDTELCFTAVQSDYGVMSVYPLINVSSREKAKPSVLSMYCKRKLQYVLTITVKVKGLEAILDSVDFVPANGVWRCTNHHAGCFTISQVFKSFQRVLKKKKI